MFFDARAAKLLQPGEHLIVVGCQGLRLVATASKRTWTYRYKATDGRMKQVAIGQWPGMPVQSAAAQWQALRDARSSGVDPVSQRRSERQARKGSSYAVQVFTVRRLVQDYIDGHLETSRKEAGALAARRALNSVLNDNPEFADRPAASITRADAFGIIEAKKATPTAAQKLRSLLGSAWDLALDAGRLDGDVPNWWRAIMRGRLKSQGKIVGGEHIGQQRRILRPAEISTLLKWLPNMHAIGRDAVVMYLWTCARGAEIFGMRPEHITKEADGYWWTVPKESTKNARHPQAVDLRVPLVGRALDVVKARIAAVGPSGWLFEALNGEQYTQHFFSTYVYGLQPHSAKVAARRQDGLVLPVAGWTPHDLRRTGRTMLSELGCANEIAEAILGHLPAGIVGTYNAYSYDRERRLWLTRLAKHLESLTSSRPGRGRTLLAAADQTPDDPGPTPPAPPPARRTGQR